MAAPTFLAAGTLRGSNGAPVIAIPAGTPNGAFQLLASFGYGTMSVNSTDQNWTAVHDTYTQDDLRARTYYRFYNSSYGSNTTIRDSGNFTAGVILNFSGVNTANPINASAAGIAFISSSFNQPAPFTTVDDTLMVGIVYTDRDVNSTNLFGFAGGSAILTDRTERFDEGTRSFNGGGIAAWTGIKESAGSTNPLPVQTNTGQNVITLTVALEGASAFTGPSLIIGG